MNEKLTPMEYLKQYLGVTDGELFDVYDEYGDCIKDCPYHFSGNQIVNERNLVDYDLVYDLMTYNYTIRKPSFVPKYDEKYFYISYVGVICETANWKRPADIAMIKCGWAFRTIKEAEANKERVMKEMKEVMGND